jgi:two-component system response regulator FixJ
VRSALYIVDDDDAARASLHALLSGRFGCVVRGFRSGSAFLEEAVDTPPGVLLIDVDTSGTDLLKAIDPRQGRFVRVAMGGKASVTQAVTAMKAHAADFIEKPCDPPRLIAAVEDAVAQLEAARTALERKQAALANIGKLSARELDVLKGLIDGRPNKQIAHELGLSPRTVEIYRANLMDKLEVRSLSEALRIAFAAGLIPEP